MDLHEFIKNGNVESYVFGLATDEEAAEMAVMLKKHPELRTELDQVERAYIRLAYEEAVMPPKELRARTVKPYSWAETKDREDENKKNYTFINIQPNKESYITVHKVWKWIFFAAFLLFKFCLFLAIYFYFKYRQIETQQQEREKFRQEQLQSSSPR